MPNLIDLTGQRFGTFTVRGRTPGPTDARSAWWLAACDCGADLPVRGDSLKSGKTHCPKCSGKHQGRRAGPTSKLSPREAIAIHSEFVTECGCQIWTASVDRFGYGRLTVNGKTTHAHRASWECANGPIPDSLWVLHRCDTPPCINPDHLFLGTPADNVADMIRKQRHRFGRRHLYR